MISNAFNAIKDFIKLESAGGATLAAATVLALVVANSPLAGLYGSLIGMPVEIRVGPLHLAKPLVFWINDGLMAVFFFLVGLELKREVLEGELSDLRKVALPALGALGGMAVPAAIYALINYGDAAALRGWAIPAATDIAFALGVLALLGTRVPLALKVFLVSIAIFDDIGAIAVIAVFYSSDIAIAPLFVVLACLSILFVLNRRGVTEVMPFIFTGVVMWIAVLKSGVHATLAGVVLAQFIPLRVSQGSGPSPLHQLEHDLHEVVAFGILPIFAFVNAGLSLSGAGVDSFFHPVPLGIAAGLFVGKQVGVFSFCWIGVKLGVARLPEGVGWRTLYGVAVLCGIGFTMSLFIGSLAFEETYDSRMFDERIGIILGSLLSGAGGYLILRLSLRGRQ